MTLFCLSQNNLTVPFTSLSHQAPQHRNDPKGNCRSHPSSPKRKAFSHGLLQQQVIWPDEWIHRKGSIGHQENLFVQKDRIRKVLGRFSNGILFTWSSCERGMTWSMRRMQITHTHTLILYIVAKPFLEANHQSSGIVAENLNPARQAFFSFTLTSIILQYCMYCFLGD